jgi:dCMP deaminase
VVYLEGYKDNSGLEFLEKAGVHVDYIEEIE